jgi:L-alanine-DL-glutamate epimerase-like enolase superfamily enzyme
VAAAREGIGPDGILLVDAGTVWVDDVEAASRRLAALRDHRATWLEEPFVGGALEAHRRLAEMAGELKLAGGEGAHNAHLARHLIDHGGVGFIQIDTGRVGGITTAMGVAEHARARGVTYVNHTFTTHLSLSASLQPMAGVTEWEICEYPVEPSEMAAGLTRERVEIGRDGLVRLPAGPGLGVSPDVDVVRRYRVETEIRVGGRVIYRTPDV